MGTVTTSTADAPALIALDWGTSTLRAYLLGCDGRVLAQRSEPWGIMQLGGRPFADVSREATQHWPVEAVSTIACGMVGSAHGWVEAPYCPVPAGAAELANTLVRVDGVNVQIVAGLSQKGESADVMRGEETQVVGALSMLPRLRDNALVICPGTHSKWVRIRDQRIVAFTTHMTGELYAVLSAHSILGRLALSATSLLPDVAAEAFAVGVRTSRDSRRDTTALLFSARSRVLMGELRPEASLEYLSGLLIGGELRSNLVEGAQPAALIGDPALCGRYATALREFGITDVLVIDGTAPRGLWAIACAAGMCSHPPALVEVRR